MQIRWALLLLATIGVTGHPALAQSLRIHSSVPKLLDTDESSWSANLRYSVLSDYAEDVKPRGYTQSISANSGYKFNANWSVSGDFSLRAETFDGQIDKNQNQSYSETVNPSLAFELDNEHVLFGRHILTLFVHGEPLVDQPSRIEGYKGIVGGGASLMLTFWAKRLAMTHVLDASELLNTYKYAEDTTANPDMFYTYKWVNSIRIYDNLKLSYIWGIKLTRYTDAFTGYSYSNTISLSTSWQHWGMALAYDNGGFTDNGEVSLWYIDQYRRIAMATLNYNF